MKVLFCDIDGVLNSKEAFATKRANPNSRFCPDTVANLNLILEAVPELKIVISSTWRLIHPMPELKGIFRKNGIDAKRIIDKTPDLTKVINDTHTITARGNEIQAWLNENPGVERFVIIDDDDDMLHLKDRLVRTSFHDGGLLERHAVEAISLLTS